jgi:hypothetical protein
LDFGVPPFPEIWHDTTDDSMLSRTKNPQWMRQMTKTRSTWDGIEIASPKPKATIYALDVFGQPFREESLLGGHGRTDPTNLAGNQRGMGPAPFAAYTSPPKRKLYVLERRCYTSRYLLILAGWGHPQPSRVRGSLTAEEHFETNAHRQPSMLRSWGDLIKPDYLIRKDCANSLHCKEGKPDEALQIIAEYETMAIDDGCHDPEYWATIREDYSSGRLQR